MSTGNNHTLHYPRPPFAEQPQRAPGLASEMKPIPDHGETSYIGSGKLAGKKALITGGDSGIGRAVAIAYAREGADVAIGYLPEEESDAASVIALIQAEGRKAVAIPGDIRVESFCDTLVEKAVAELGGLDILVNNAGIYGQQDFYSTDDETWERYWQTNVMSGVRLSRALLPGMVQKGWGRVVFISSESACNIPADMIHYGVTKTAQLSLARGLAKFVAGSGVTVNSVLPGPTMSDGFAAMMKDEIERTGKSLEQLAKAFVMENRPSSVIQRAATVEEVANMVVYVCSMQASATSGAALRVDGGVVDDIV